MRLMKVSSFLAVAGLALAQAASAGQAAPPKPPATGTDPALLNPAQLNAKAPQDYKVKFTTTKGVIIVEVHRIWAPQGADRFYNLVKHHYYDQASFFRVLKSPRPFVAQFGINADPKVNAAWQTANIKDDTVNKSNARGTLTYAMAGPNTRTTQIFINLGDNKGLDGMGFAPFGEVVQGMNVVDSLYGDYGEGGAGGPDQGRIQAQGKAYLDKSFPKLDSIITAVVMPGEGDATAPAKAPAKAPGR
ncbi:MAG TPA: peptidylprolyl isomerase [Candidatus Acidoferrales bacterium]|nr:peptidylprolyl isomerase [Candidatus Acidoferrales bacterium]